MRQAVRLVMVFLVCRVCYPWLLPWQNSNQQREAKLDDQTCLHGVFILTLLQTARAYLAYKPNILLPIEKMCASQ